MALPGPEGHLRMPNWLVDRLARLHLNGTQWQLLWAVWRRTLCWQQPGPWRNRPWPIGTSELADACGINAQQVKRELGDLVRMNIIHRDNTPGGRGHKPITAFNLDPSTWNVPVNGSEIATLKERVADEIPIAEQKGSELATPTMEEIGEKGSGLVPPSVADSLPFTDRSATLSVPALGTPKETLKKHIKKHTPKKGKYFFDNILLTEEEYQKLVERFGEAGTKDRLEALSLYKKSKGKKYKDDYATVLAWEHREKRIKGEQSGTHRQSARQLTPRTQYTKPEDY